MKRLQAMLAALLAAVLLCPVCEAVDGPVIRDDEVYVAASDGVPCLASFSDGRLEAPLFPGDTIYFVIEGADRAEDLSDLYARVLFDFTGSCGEELAGTPAIEYRMRYDAAGRRQIGYSYLVAVPIAETEERSAQELCARVSLRRQKSGSVRFSATVQPAGALQNAAEISCTGMVCPLRFEDGITAVRLEFGEAVFTVEIAGQGEANVGLCTYPFTDLAWAYPSAVLSCLDWQHEPIFNRIGVLEIPAAPGSFLYEVQGRELADRTDTYVAATGCFTLETRRLGSYVISDRALGTPERTDLPPNPLTGVQ